MWKIIAKYSALFVTVSLLWSIPSIAGAQSIEEVIDGADSNPNVSGLWITSYNSENGRALLHIAAVDNYGNVIAYGVFTDLGVLQEDGDIPEVPLGDYIEDLEFSIYDGLLGGQSCNTFIVCFDIANQFLASDPYDNLNLVK